MLNETNLNTVLFSILRVFHDITFHSFLYSQSCERHPTSLREGEMSKVGQIPHFQVLRVSLIKTLRACLRFLSMRETAKHQPSWCKTLGLRERNRLRVKDFGLRPDPGLLLLGPGQATWTQ